MALSDQVMTLEGINGPDESCASCKPAAPKRPGHGFLASFYRPARGGGVLAGLGAGGVPDVRAPTAEDRKQIAACATAWKVQPGDFGFSPQWFGPRQCQKIDYTTPREYRQFYIDGAVFKLYSKSKDVVLTIPNNPTWLGKAVNWIANNRCAILSASATAAGGPAAGAAAYAACAGTTSASAPPPVNSTSQGSTGGPPPPGAPSKLAKATPWLIGGGVAVTLGIVAYLRFR